MKFAYYPGCSLDATAVEYNISAKAVAKHLGIDFREIPDWNCCGASSAHKSNHLLSLALPARNLALAEKEGLDVAVPCAACFNRFKTTEKAVKESASTREKVADIIEMEYNGSNQIYNLVDVIVNRVGLEEVANKVVKPLTGLKVASYYGCLLLRPPEIAQFDDPENPTSMDRLVETLGGEPVEWGFKTECCGAGHTTTKPEVASVMLDRIYDNAHKNGADCIISACPLCMLNLDMRQKEVAQKQGGSYHFPVFYFTELMGLAMGYSPKDLGIEKHFIDPKKLLDEKDLLRHPATRNQ